MMQLNLPPQHVESLWSVLISSPECHECRKGVLNQEVVLVGYVLGRHSRTEMLPVMRLAQSLIHHLFQMRSLLNA